LDHPELRPFGGSKLGGSRLFTRKRRYGGAKFDHNIFRAGYASRRTPALVGSCGKSLSHFSVARGRASDFAPQRFIKWRTEQLKVHRPAARRILRGQPLDEVLSLYDQILRRHARNPSCLTGFALYLIRAFARSRMGLFSPRLPT
jgi:hypothetical protein